MLEVNGKHLHGGTFKPKDSTPEEVERARLAALESCRKLEEKYFTMKQIAGQKSKKKNLYVVPVCCCAYTRTEKVNVILK